MTLDKTRKSKRMRMDDIEEDAAVNTGTAVAQVPSLKVYIYCSCGEIAPTRDLFRAAFNRLAPELGVVSINTSSVTKSNNRRPEGPCEVTANWSNVPKTMEDQYEKATESVIGEVIGPHVGDRIQVDFFYE